MVARRILMALAAIGLLLLLLIGIGLATIPRLRVTTNRQACRFNLSRIGGLLLAKQAGGRLRYPEGSAYLLQVKDEVKAEDMKVFRCPEGPDDVLISYRGPDATALERIRQPAGESIIIACDANGENGDAPHHDDGVCVLWSSGKTEFIRWEEMEGYDGGPVKVGPGSPDPRFRHLVR